MSVFVTPFLLTIGAKLCMLSDLLGNSGSLTGVDVSRDRLAACRTMLLKYTLGDRCRLFIADGTSFSLLPLRPSMNVKSCTWNLEVFFPDKVKSIWS